MKLTQIGSKVIYHLREEGLSALPRRAHYLACRLRTRAERREHTAARAQADAAYPRWLAQAQPGPEERRRQGETRFSHGLSFLIPTYNTAPHLLQELADALPPADTVTEADYRSLVTLLAESRRAIRTQEEQRYGDMVDYYTMWAHQIKTPIASMRLTLQNEDSGLARSLSGDLMRVEQYVEMVLVFLRLDSSTTDYVIRAHSLDDIVRPAVRKFAGEFIRRRLRLDYQPLDRTVVTDAKWLGFVVEQVLSNALKYTASGSVTIAMDGDDLCIRDTGMGIAPEDLPRIFDRGFTGLNGRRDTRASGIGLYLCRRICRSLGHTIRASSVPNQGTEIRIGLGQKKTLPE